MITGGNVPKALPSSSANIATTNCDCDCDDSDEETRIAIASYINSGTSARCALTATGSTSTPLARPAQGPMLPWATINQSRPSELDAPSFACRPRHQVELT